jgi:ankyrin repeat protein
MQLALEHGANPNHVTRWGFTALHQALRRDNGLIIIELLLNHGADPTIPTRNGISAIQIAAHRGRGDTLNLFNQRGIPTTLPPFDQLIAACAQNNEAAIQTLTTTKPQLTAELLAQSGTLLAQFAGNNNAEGLRRLIKLGVSPAALYHGDGYFEIPANSTALHVAAWRAQHDAVRTLIEAGAPINALDGNGHTALQRAILATTDSYWKYRRTTDSIEALLKAGATTTGITLPTGYEEADKLLINFLPHDV